MANPLARQLQLLRDRYESLEKRDRVAVLGLGAFFLILFLFYGVWSPSNQFLEDRIADRDRQLGLLQFMRASEKEARAAGSSGSRAPTGQSLLTEVSRSAQAFRINPNRLQPEGTDSVSVWFDSVVFNDLVKWLEDQSKRGILIRQVSIDRQDTVGLVNARIVLRN